MVAGHVFDCGRDETAYDAVVGFESKKLGGVGPDVEKLGRAVEGDGAADADPAVGAGGGDFGAGVLAKLKVEVFALTGVETELSVDVSGEVHGSHFGLRAVGSGEVEVSAGV